MISRIRTTISVELDLNEAEAIWLKQLMQNPIGDIPIDYEDETDKQMRAIFLNALKGVTF